MEGHMGRRHGDGNSSKRRHKPQLEWRHDNGERRRVSVDNAVCAGMDAALPAGNRRPPGRVLFSTRSVGCCAPTAPATVDGGDEGPKAPNLERPGDTDTSTPEHQSRYDLLVVPARPNGMLLDQVGVDFVALENSLAELERQMRVDHETLPEAVVELRKEIARFRAKLEAADHLRVMGYCKELPPPEDCRRLQFRRRSHEEQRRVKESFFHMGLAPLPLELSEALRTASFDCSPLSDAQILALLEFMFVDFGLPEAFNFERTTLRSFLYEVYKNYNEVPFHNFRHGFCVTQMMYAIAHTVDLPSKIGDLETLILLTSSICHDLDHPGYNNIYQINARTELALRYNDISPLENHHCSVAFRILDLPECNILSKLAPSVYRVFREGVIRCILATDMARHNEILDQFRDIVSEFDFSNKAHTDLLTMVLIKVADISNEARPMHVAEPWLDKLLTEFFRQSDAEKMEGLPVTPFMDRDKITKPSSQCSFIGLVLLPLFEALGTLLPELQELIIIPVREALEYYRRLNEACREERIHRKSVVDLGDTPTPSDSNTSDDKSMVKSSSGHSVKSRRSFQQIRSRSRSAEEEALESQEMEGLCEDEEDEEDESDVETATEVEVSEKTLKFKISTESGRKSYPGSRKGSRDKNQLSTEFQHHEFARAVREHHERNEHRGSIATSPLSGRSVEFSRCNGDREKCLSFEEDTVSRSSDRRFSENSAYTSGSNTSKRGSSGALMLSSSRTPAVSEDPREAETDDAIQPSCPVILSAHGTPSCGTPSHGTPSHGTPSHGTPSHGTPSHGTPFHGTPVPTQSTPKQRSPSSFLKKLKTLTERLSFGVSLDKDSSNEGRSQRGSPSPHNHKTTPSPHSSHGSTCEASEDLTGCHERATTLPKTKKHQGHASGRRSWKTILGSGGKGRRSSSSLEALSPVESPGEGDDLCRDRESLCTSPKRDSEQRGTRSRYLSGSGDVEADVDVSLTGSLESILQKNDSSGNNNNRKKTSSNFWSSPGNRRGGFLNRLSSSNKQSMDSITGGDAGLSAPSTASHSPGSQTPTKSGLIASFAASFRGKKSGNQSKTVSPSICAPSPSVQDGVK